MKKILASLLTAAAFTAPAAHAQKMGDAVTPAALQKLEWIQGEAPQEWEPGKLYILECWATWCGPCIANIPHVDALYDKYKDQGLRVIGVDVWEDGKDKVAEFVKGKGDGMSYPIAYTGKGGVFETEWLKAADVKGIPHAFLVRDGKVILTAHPAVLTDEVIENLLKGGDDEKAALDSIHSKQEKDLNVGKAMQAYTSALKKKDADGMATATADLKAAQPENPYLPIFESETFMLRGDWAGLERLIDSSTEPKQRQMLVGNVGRSITRKENVPAETLSKVIKAYEAELAAAKKGPADAVALSRLYWIAGDKDRALKEARESVNIMKTRSPEAPGLSGAPFDKFCAAVEGGTMPSEDEFTGWMREAIAARSATAVKPATPAIPASPRVPASGDDKAKE